MENSKRFLVLYKQLLQQAKRVEDKSQRNMQMDSVQSFFRDHLLSGKPIDGGEMTKFFESKMGYLKVVSPREISDSSTAKPSSIRVETNANDVSTTSDNSNAKIKSGKQRFVMIKGKLLEATSGSKSLPRAIKTGIDPDDLARHKYLLERQHFMHRR